MGRTRPNEYNITTGLPQGSLVVPLLWRVMYHIIECLLLPSQKRLRLLALWIAVAAKCPENAEFYPTETVRVAKKGWTDLSGLENKQKRNTVKWSVKVDKVTITSKSAIKYLEVLIDSKRPKHFRRLPLVRFIQFYTSHV